MPAAVSKGSMMNCAEAFSKARNWSRDSIDVQEESLWAALPPELLRDVIERVEASDGDWPHRRSLVACAGVCKAWRDLTR